MLRTCCIVGLVSAVGLAVLGAARAAVATQARPPGGKLAVIDVVMVFNEFQRQKDLTEEMKKLQQSLQSESQARMQKIDAAQRELDMWDPNDPAYSRKMQDLLAMQVDYKNWFDMKQALLTREVAVWTWRIYKEITESVQALAEERGLDLVVYRDEFPPVSTDPEEMRERIRRRMILYHSPAIDLTQDALARLNTGYRSQPAQPMLNVP